MYYECMHVSFYLPIHLSIYLFIHIYAYLPISLSIYTLINQSIYPPRSCLSSDIYTYTYISINLIYSSIYSSVYGQIDIVLLRFEVILSDDWFKGRAQWVVRCTKVQWMLSSLFLSVIGSWFNNTWCKGRTETLKGEGEYW